MVVGRERVVLSEGTAGVADGLADRRAMDRLFGVYLLVSGVALVFPGRPGGWPILATLHLLGAAMGLGVVAAVLRRAGRGTWRLPTLLHDWYPLLLTPFLYTELATLNRGVWGGRYFDPLIQEVDRAVFGSLPSVTLSRTLPYLPLSEALHAAYLSYYLIIYVPPLVLYALGRRGDFRRLVFPLMLTFFVHYLFFVYFPVQGPRYLFPGPGGELREGAVYRLAHRLLEAGSSRGAAFPSSHVGVSVAQTILVFRFLPALAPFVALAATGLAVGAVYAGFHYATDVIVGALLGTALVLAAPTVKRVLLGGEARS
jgi:membrane-associated phospholipid phosphatase